MKISQLVETLKGMQARHGDIEVTCTASTLEDNHGGAIPDVYESTVETLVVYNEGDMGPRVRLYP